jgi:hypothetical protein
MLKPTFRYMPVGVCGELYFTCRSRQMRFRRIAERRK